VEKKGGLLKREGGIYNKIKKRELKKKNKKKTLSFCLLIFRIN
jgi:hypothetical protein